jgi:hypothetical protein
MLNVIGWHQEVADMSANTIPAPVQPDRADSARASRLTRWAFAMPLTYLLWFWVSFAFGYFITDVVGAYPSVDPGPALTELGLGGYLGIAIWGLQLALPALVGVWLAMRARRFGAGWPAVAALLLNLVIALGAFALVALG